MLRNQLERAREVALHEPVAGLVRLAVVLEEIRAGRRVAAQALVLRGEQHGHVVADFDAVVREIDGGRQEVFPRQFAELLVRVPHAGHGARDTGREMAEE